MIACVLITHFRAKIELKRNAHLINRDAIIVDKSTSLVVDRFPRTSYIEIGMTIEKVLFHYPNAVLIYADESYYERIFDELMLPLHQVSPLLEPAEVGCIYVDIKGLLPLYVNIYTLVDALLDEIPEYFSTRVGIAEGKFPAYVAALNTHPNDVTVLSSSESLFLAPYSINLLPIPDRMKSSLHNFGIYTMGHITAQSLEDLQSQFGFIGNVAWYLSHGIDDRILNPIAIEQEITEHADLSFNTVSMDVIVLTLETMLDKAFARPQMRKRYVRKISVELYTPNSTCWRKTLVMREPTNQIGDIKSRIHSNLKAKTYLPGPVDRIVLTLSDFTDEQGVQSRMFSCIREDQIERNRKLVNIDRNIRAQRCGIPAIHRVVKVLPNHILPEMRYLKVPIDSSVSNTVETLNSPVPVEVLESDNSIPQKINTKRNRYQITKMNDLWEINLWWMPEPIHRTYYKLEDFMGKSITVFQDINTLEWYQQNY